MSDTPELFPAEVIEGTAIAINKDDMLREVLASGNIDVLDRYLSMRERERAIQARIAFEDAFTIMRSELPAVAKKRDNGATKSKYAPIEEIQRICDPVINRHGFSYSWREEAIPEGKRVWMDISGFGHTKSNYFDCPKIAGNNAQNAIQVAGAMSTYGRRYTFVSGFGVIIEGEDADGQITNDIEQLRLDLSALCEERDGTGKLKLPQNAFDIINKELKKPAEEMSVERMKAFYKKAKALMEAKK
jgi:hypothetical protein